MHHQCAFVSVRYSTLQSCKTARHSPHTRVRLRFFLRHVCRNLKWCAFQEGNTQYALSENMSTISNYQYIYNISSELYYCTYDRLYTCQSKIFLLHKINLHRLFHDITVNDNCGDLSNT